MADISAKIVKELREKTGAGMMDCKKALVQANGDMEAAVDFLRKSGIAKAEKKSGRATKEGRIVSAISGNTGVLLEALCETDFVNKNEKFIEYVDTVLAKIVDMDAEGDVTEAVAEMEKEALTDMIAKIGENMQLRRAVRWNCEGKCGSYLHMGGRKGVMVEVEGDATDETVNYICLHITAGNPQYINPEDIPADVIEKEKEIAAAQLEGKPAEIMDKIVTGKINKWYNEVCLTKQPWVLDDKVSMEKANPGITVKRFIRWELGEEL
jgi:elongation factor Ts